MWEECCFRHLIFAVMNHNYVGTKNSECLISLIYWQSTLICRQFHVAFCSSVVAAPPSSFSGGQWLAFGGKCSFICSLPASASKHPSSSGAAVDPPFTFPPRSLEIRLAISAAAKQRALKFARAKLREISRKPWAHSSGLIGRYSTPINNF